MRNRMIAPVDGGGPGFIDTLHRLAMPVVVVCARSGSARSCATTTAMYVSADPARIALSLREGSETLRLARETGRFTVSILSSGQADIATRAARPARTEDKPAEQGIPMRAADARFAGDSVADALAAWCCVISDEMPAGGSRLIVGEVEAVRVNDASGSALIRDGREYRTVGTRAHDGHDDYPV